MILIPFLDGFVSRLRLSLETFKNNKNKINKLKKNAKLIDSSTDQKFCYALNAQVRTSGFYMRTIKTLNILYVVLTCVNSIVLVKTTLKHALKLNEATAK